jgi:hypothetical protein
LAGDGELADIGDSERVLADLRDVFTPEGKPAPEWFSTANLLTMLHAIEEAPWSDWSNGKPLTAQGLAGLLRLYGITSKNIRDGGRVVKGYYRAQFVDAWGRYLLAPLASSLLPLHPLPDAESPDQPCSGSVAADGHASRYSHDQGTSSLVADVADVADEQVERVQADLFDGDIPDDLDVP